MRGRRPTPTALKELAGNPGKRPLNKSEPNPEKGVPSCPAHIVGVARTEWNRISAALNVLGLVTELDRSALAAYCICYGRWVDAEKKVKKLGVLCLPPKEQEERDQQQKLFVDLKQELPPINPSQLIWNPYLAVANKAMEQMMKCLIEFGMTPSSRARVHGSTTETKNKFEAFLDASEPSCDVAVQ